MSDRGAPAMVPIRLSPVLLAFFISQLAAAQQQSPTTQQTSVAAGSSRPRLAVVVGIFSVIISVSFLLLLYARFCYHAISSTDRQRLGAGREPDIESHQDGILRLWTLQESPRSSGVDMAVIESLPFFRFSSLKGSREGMECVVCLSRFEGAELLRFLPKCKHAFHKDCVDRWLEDHSSCPLCRRPVLIEDLTLFKYSTSSRFLLGDPAAQAGEADLELYVEREQGEEAGCSLGSSIRKMSRVVAGKECKKEGMSAGEGTGKGKAADGREGRERQEHFYHRFKHRIIVSDVVYKNRWSDLNSSDLVSLNAEMLRSLSSRRFPYSTAVVDVAVISEEQDQSFPPPTQRNSAHASADESMHKIKDEMERKRSLESKSGRINSAGSPSSSGTNSQRQHSNLPKSLDPCANNRTMSEIVDISRFADAAGRTRNNSTSKAEERVRRVWLPIARRTVQWTTEREKRPDVDG